MRSHGAPDEADLFAKNETNVDFGLRAAGIADDDDPTAPGPWTFANTQPNLIETDEWHHLALRWDGDTVAVFVDGALQAAAPYDPVPITGLSYHGESPFGLGIATGWGDGASHEFLGRLDDVRLYERARSDVEIFTDFVTRGRKPAKPGRK